MIRNPTKKGSGYGKANNLIDQFAKFSDNYTVTHCQNGYVVEVSGVGSDQKRISAKFVFKMADELKTLAQYLAWIPKK